MSSGVTMRSVSIPKIRVLIVDDSSIVRSSLRAMLELDGDIDIVGEGEDAFSALALVETLLPDLVTMDVQMPGKSGLEAVEQIMARRPVPILVVTAEPLSDEAGVAFRAIENGALDIMPKPSFTDAAAAAELRQLVRSLARTPVFQRADAAHVNTLPVPLSHAPEILAVIAGSGGMPSVMGLLARLPGPLRCPLVVHQPVAPDKIIPYSRHLARLAKQPVKIATGPVTTFQPGEILLVLGQHATFVNKGELSVNPGEPSATALLTSMAATYGVTGVAVVLAGQGTDGVEGLRALHRLDAPTYAESPLSATINELPASAVAADVVNVTLPMAQLAEQLYVLMALG